MENENFYRKDRVAFGLLAAGIVASTFIIISAIPISILEIHFGSRYLTSFTNANSAIKTILLYYVFSVIFVVPATLIAGSVTFALLIRFVSFKPFNCALTGGVLTPLPFFCY
jgi:predicted tellurium resistance membrane protein TerC